MAVDYSLGVGAPDLQSQLLRLVEGERTLYRAESVGRAQTSLFHQKYLTHDLDLGDRTFLADNYDISVMAWAIKARAELINLNFKPWIMDNNNNCSLCNLQEIENVFHFVARCPVFSDLRPVYFGRRVLDVTELYEYLNGRNWQTLGNYLKTAWVRRWDLVSEFNY